ncbi:MAG: DUF58 domain-containing protein [Pyrinomonadaceae bacterium]|nr:DUF58 domain-containing protein [Pyrinomonadaceae bacterium]
MNLRALSQLFSFRDIRNSLMGLIVVLGGLVLAGVTLWAHQTNNFRLAGIAATASLGFVLLILIFVVPPLARSASAEASQLDLPFEFTTGGAVYLGLLVIVGFAAWNTGNNLLFIVLAFLTSAFIVGFFIGNFCLKKLEVKMRFPEAIFAEEPTPLIVSLFNKKRLFPTYSITTEVRGKEREKSLMLNEIKKILPAPIAEKIVRPPLLKHTLDYFYYLPHFETIENKTEHIFKYRGRFIIKDFELSTRFPFGFFRHRRRLSAQEAEIIVFPKIEPIESEILHLPFEIGKRVLPKKGAGQDLLTLREYQPQDDLRHVDWKATARSQKVIVRDFAAEDERRVTVIFDTRIQQTSEEKNKTLRARIEEEQKGEKLTKISQKFDKGVSVTASILAYFTDEQAEIRLIIDDEIGEFGFGKTHLHDCLKRLALIEPKICEDNEEKFPDKTLEEVFLVRQNSYTFFITTQNDKNIAPEINQRAKVLKY